MLLYPINAIVSGGRDRVAGLTIGPRVLDWMTRVQARPAYQRGLKRLQEEEARARAARSATEEQSATT